MKLTDLSNSTYITIIDEDKGLVNMMLLSDSSFNEFVLLNKILDILSNAVMETNNPSTIMKDWKSDQDECPKSGSDRSDLDVI